MPLERFVRSFIKKSRRERLLYELTTPEKRYRGLDRFCHQSKDLIDPKKVILSGDDMERSPEFLRFVREHDETCLVLSPDFYPNGRSMPLSDATEQALMCPDAVLVIGGTFAVIFGEAMKGGREKYLLSEGKQ